MNGMIHRLNNGSFHTSLHFFHTLASRRIPLTKQLSVQTTKIARIYSVAHFSSIPATVGGKATYSELQEASNQQKTEKVFKHIIITTLNMFDIKEHSLIHTQQWDILQKHLLYDYKYQLPQFEKEDHFKNIQNLLGIFNRTLVKRATTSTHFDLADYVFTPTEFSWAFYPVGIPFTRHDEQIPQDISAIQDILEQCPNVEALPKKLDHELDQKLQTYALATAEKDASAATLLITPHLDANTILHESGCWNGQNLFNLLMYASLKNQLPKYCIGTDINNKALNMAQSVANMLGFNPPFIQFYLSNAICPMNPRGIHLEFSKEVRLALRLIPVLDPLQARTFLQQARQDLQNKEDVMVVSFALPKGQMYELNMKRVEHEPFTKKEFSGGVTVLQAFSPKNMLPFHLQQRTPQTILNTYYTWDGFTKLLDASGFKIQHAITAEDLDNERVVVQLQTV